MSFLFGKPVRADLKDQIATVRWTVAGEGWTEPNFNFANGKMQTNLGGTSKKKSTS